MEDDSERAEKHLNEDYTKKIISSYSGRIKRLLGKTKEGTRNLKVIFHDFPGGAEGFKIITRFCYSNGKISINPLNVALLHCIAILIEINTSFYGLNNLFEQTEKSLEEIKYGPSFWLSLTLSRIITYCEVFRART